MDRGSRAHAACRLSAVILLALLWCALAVVPARALPSELAERRAEAIRLAREVASLDESTSRQVEEYDRARYFLEQTRRKEADALRRASAAEADLHGAEARFDDRLRRVYKQDPLTSLDLLMTSRTTADLMSRLRYVASVLRDDRSVIDEVDRRRAAVTREKARLTEERRQGQQLTEGLAAKRRQIEDLLAQRREQLSSVEADIARLAEQERQRAVQVAADQRSTSSVGEPAALPESPPGPTDRPSPSTTRAPASTAPTSSTSAQPQTPARDGPRATTTAIRPARTTTTRAPAPATPPSPTTTAPPPPEEPSIKAPARSARGAQIVANALLHLGVPYVWGGASPAGFDCSGLTQYVLAQVGVELPHSSSLQSLMGTPVPRSALAPGDLVFFGRPVHHVGIYKGNGSYIEAPYTGAVVRVSPFSRSDFVGARRF